MAAALVNHFVASSVRPARAAMTAAWKNRRASPVPSANARAICVPASSIRPAAVNAQASASCVKTSSRCCAVAEGILKMIRRKGRVATIRQVEQFVTEFVTIEQGMMLQNLGLMAQALGLGGFQNFANHEFGWFQALEFRMEQMPVNRHVGAGWLPSLAMKFLKRNPSIPYPIGLERNGEVLLKPFCPPYYKSMADAVRAAAEVKFGASGIFRSSGQGSAWPKHGEVVQQIPATGAAAIEATIAYCEYVWNRYGRFPACLTPYRTVLGFQACHLDVEFYDKFYRPDALSETQRKDSEA